MNKHNLTYVDMYPQAIEEPSDGVIIASAAALVAALGLILVVLFSL